MYVGRHPTIGHGSEAVAADLAGIVVGSTSW